MRKHTPPTSRKLINSRTNIQKLSPTLKKTLSIGALIGAIGFTADAIGIYSFTESYCNSEKLIEKSRSLFGEKKFDELEKYIENDVKKCDDNTYFFYRGLLDENTTSASISNAFRNYNKVEFNTGFFIKAISNASRLAITEGDFTQLEPIYKRMQDEGYSDSMLYYIASILYAEKMHRNNINSDHFILNTERKYNAWKKRITKLQSFDNNGNMTLNVTTGSRVNLYLPDLFSSRKVIGMYEASLALFYSKKCNSQETNKHISSSTKALKNLSEIEIQSTSVNGRHFSEIATNMSTKILNLCMK